MGSETFLAEHLPLPEDNGEDDEDVISFELPQHLAGSSVPVQSPPLALIAASHTRPPSKVPSGHKHVPSIGTLTDARNVYTTRGSRRAR